MRGSVIAGGLILAAAGGLFFARLGDRGLVSEEVRWAEIAREMRASGDPLRPTFNDKTYYDKPVGSYWLVVAASFLTGEVDETAARLPAAAAGWLAVLFTMLLAARVYDRPAAVVAGAVLASAYGVAVYARRATADMETVAGVLIAVWWYARNREKSGTAWTLGLWLVMAATSLTKGLLGFALPGLVLVVHGTWEAVAAGGGWRSVYRGNRWLVTPWTLVGLPLGLAAYALPFALTGEGLADGFRMVYRENVQRFFAPHNHAGPVTVYFGAILALSAPWAVFLPAALWPPKASSPRLPRAYFWAVFAFFLASASRRSYYLLPVLPPLAMLVGRVLTTQNLTPIARRLRTAGIAAFAVGIVAAGLLLVPPGGVLPAPYDRLPPLPEREIFAAGWVLAAAGLGVAIAKRRAVVGLTAAAFAGMAYLQLAALPAADAYRTRTAFAETVRSATAGEPDKLGVYRARDVVFDLGGTAPDYATADDVAAAAAAGKVRWLVARTRYLVKLTVPFVIAAAEEIHPWDGPDQLGDKMVLLDLARR